MATNAPNPSDGTTDVDAAAFEQVRQHAAAVGAAQRVMVNALLKAGRQISLAKRRLTVAQWAQWLADVAGYGVAEGSLLIRASERFSVSQGAEDLTPAAVLVLAGQDVPPAAIADALALARRGSLVTAGEAKRLVRKHRKAAD